MLNKIKKILFFASFLLLIIIGKEMIELFSVIYAFSEIAAYAFAVVLFAGLYYFVGIPLYKILKLPKSFSPVYKIELEEIEISNRIEKFKKNKFLNENNFDFTLIKNDSDSYKKIISVLEKETNVIRKKYISNLFYSSSISQNGFLDGILILSTAVNMIKEIFVLYNGRVSNNDLLIIGKKVYYSIIIGGSEGIEYTTDEFVSKIALGGINNVPFLSKVTGSLADGFVNAALLTRVSIITENYCKKVYIKSDKELYPSIDLILKTTKLITEDFFDKVKFTLQNMSKESVDQLISKVSNPVNHVIKESFEKVKNSKEFINKGFESGKNLFSSINIFGSKKEKDYLRDMDL